LYRHRLRCFPKSLSYGYFWYTRKLLLSGHRYPLKLPNWNIPINRRCGGSTKSFRPLGQIQRPLQSNDIYVLFQHLWIILPFVGPNALGISPLVVLEGISITANRLNPNRAHVQMFLSLSNGNSRMQKALGTCLYGHRLLIGI